MAPATRNKIYLISFNLNMLQKAFRPLAGKQMIQRSQRLFSAASNAEYQTIDHDRWYTPTNKVNFSGKQLTVFNSNDCKEVRYVPWEVKEASFKGTVGIFTVYLMNLVQPLGPGYMLL